MKAPIMSRRLNKTVSSSACFETECVRWWMQSRWQIIPDIRIKRLQNCVVHIGYQNLKLKS